MRHLPLTIALAGLILVGSGAVALRGSPSAVPASSTLTAADTRLRAALASAAMAAQPAPDAEAQNARLVAADAALDAMADVPAQSRADLDRKASALLFVADFEVQEDWRLARSIARDALYLDGARIAP